MARFAFWKRKASTPDTLNLAGGQAHVMSPKAEFASILLTTFTTDTFYKSADDQVTRVAELVRSLEEPLFVAKAAIYTRKQNGLRSVSHIVAGELAQRKDVKGQPWLRKFYRSVVQRPDDITETLAYLKGANPDLRKLSNAMKRGFGEALSTFDAYQLAKYLRTDRDPNLIDAVNLLHPKSTPALAALMTGTLKPAETWETKLTQAGQKAVQNGLTEEEKAELKGQAWGDLLRERKLGYTACLRNLRNIAEQAPEVFPLALAFLSDAKQVEKSLVMPFQFITAVEAIKGSKADSSATRRSLEKATELSLKNVPTFEGKTLIAVDVSGSMNGRPLKIAALFAAVLFKSQADAEVMLFDAIAKVLRLHPSDSLTTLTESIMKEATGGGTDFRLIFSTAKKAYDRIVILSDMQAWVGHDTPAAEHKTYKRTFACDPRIYSFDLTGHGTLPLPESRVYALAGFSDAALATMKNLERDPHALVHEIEAVEL